METEVNLKEYIHNKMDILFLALNAPENSNSNAHWFSGTLSFWNLLFRSGLITSEIMDPIKGDERVFSSHDINYNNWIYGVTDLNRDIVMTNSTHVETNSAQVKRILNILEENSVNKLCIMHSKVAEEFESAGLINRSNGYGIVGKYKETIIYEVPFHNASKPAKHQYYGLLICDNKQVNCKVHSTESQINSSSQSKIIPGAPLKQTPLTSLGISFILPAFGNEITESDINSGQLRITVDFKSHFPSSNQDITVIHNNIPYQVLFVNRGSRSHLLKLGKNLINKIGIRPGSKVELRKINNCTFNISLKR